MIARLAARLDVANLLALEIINQLFDRLADAETLLTRMLDDRNVRARRPVRRGCACCLVGCAALLRRCVRCMFVRMRDVRFDVCEALLHLAERGAQGGQFLTDISIGVVGRALRFACEAGRDALSQCARLILLCAHRVRPSSVSRSILSTTPTIAE